jgi:hypothetical protein
MLRRTSSLSASKLCIFVSSLIQLEESETLNEKAFFALCFLFCFIVFTIQFICVFKCINFSVTEKKISIQAYNDD